MLQHTATCLGARHAATRCNTLQHAATHCNLTRPLHIRMRARVLLSCCSTATHCNNPASHTATTHRNNTLQSDTLSTPQDARAQPIELRLEVCVLVDKVNYILCVYTVCVIVCIVL